MDISTETRSNPTILNDRYHVLRILGDGGFGTTYLAEDHHLPSRQPCVIKQLKPIHANPEIQQKVREKFEREAAIQEELSRGNAQIPKLYAYFVQDERFYLVEEYIDGDTLTQKVSQEGLLSESAVKKLLERILPIIDYIHGKNIIHRDIKPDNIILRRQDGQPVLIDFGAVRETMGTVLHSRGQNSRTMIVGTEGFSAPEQAIGRPVFSSDFYSLGATALYLMSGKTLADFGSDPHTGALDWRSSVPSTPVFAAIIEKAIAMNSLDRYQSAREMLTALTTLSPASNIMPTQISSPPPTTISPSPPLSMPPTTWQTAPGNGGEWKKAVIVGGLVGCSILASTLLIRAQLAGLVERIDDPQEKQEEKKETTLKKPEPVVSPVPSPVIVSPTPSDVPPPPKIGANATIAGQPGSKNIRRGPGLEYGVRHTAYTGDRVRVLQETRNSDNFPWYEIYFPVSGAQGWIAGNLLAIDGQPRYIDPPSPSSSFSATTNAIVAGNPGIKNMRSGPGTVYGVVGKVSTGTRIQIRGSGRDREGYLWYNVHAPATGRSGWIAAQLISRD